MTKTFNSGLEIQPLFDPLGFKYGETCFGPTVETRKLDAIRKSLMDPNCTGPDIVYAIAMDVGKKEHQSLLKELHLLFGVVTYASGRLGNEPIRSQGHIHSRSAYAGGWSTPEVYEIWEGKAIIYMQETANDNPGKCYAIHAAPGDIVVVPPFWAHATISADSETPLTFGAWCNRNYSFEYDEVRAHNGLAWYPVYKHGQLTWQANKNYDRSGLIEKSPESYSELGIQQEKSIYSIFEEDPKIFEYVPRPYLIEKYWQNFIP
ncbi:hypothetical protein K8352_16510 [Flavobacteriaceae bacterium F89]|uniref:glucose-6-phosphate isomerase n=1 Tax=Cerina litoralis TaxID=2874477 RepID=A0AAE3EWG7_9FLAO|nr:glucose-6-phosphate isomerase family protein [Cerina litoralis]MCG2462365.1 hypothetical protein [Cerina litoralis]